LSGEKDVFNKMLPSPNMARWLTFADTADWVTLEQGDEPEIAGVHGALGSGEHLAVRNPTRNSTFPLTYHFTKRQAAIILAGGLLNYIKMEGAVPPS
jgi:aconitate hydratase